MNSQDDTRHHHNQGLCSQSRCSRTAQLPLDKNPRVALMLCPQTHKRLIHCSAGGLPPLALRFKTRRMPEEEARAFDSGSALRLRRGGPGALPASAGLSEGWQRRLIDRRYGDQLLGATGDLVHLLFFFRACVERLHVHPQLLKQVRILFKGRVHPRIQNAEQVG